MGRVSNGSGLREHLLLFSRFLRSPRNIGAIAPSSPVLARAMVRDVDLGGGAVRVVELGPGTGAFTSAIVSRLGPSARYLAIDREAAFVERLRELWPQIECVCASAAMLPALAADRGLAPVDHIISGLPFASLPGAVTTQILDGIEQTLRPGGTFTTFQYVHAYGLPPAVAFRHDINRRMGGQPTRRLVVWNIPPAFVLTWKRLRCVLPKSVG
jgi:phosphatidylethanolamine/phosphatidyl-N-methylethanolamine N-methyltransferase